MQDKRQYVRIEAHLPVQYRIIKDEEFEEARNRCLEKRIVNHELNFSHVLKEFDLETTTNPQSLISEGMDPLTAKVFGEIDRKLNLLLRLLVDNRISNINNEIFHEVNLSGGGIKLLIAEQLNIGDKAEMEISLPVFPPVNMVTIAEVARVFPSGDPLQDDLYETAFQFIDIDEDDREKIIQYVFKRQRQFLRNRATKVNTD